MGSKWRKAKLALGLNLCVYLPKTTSHESPPPLDLRRGGAEEGFSDAALLSPCYYGNGGGNEDNYCDWVRPMTPSPSSRGLKLSGSGSKSSSSSKHTCSICLNKMKQGGGQAIFTAECSHSFHFQCIASSVKHGNKICPVCRAKWKEVPSQAPCPNDLQGRLPIGPSRWQHDDLLAMMARRRDAHRRHVVPRFQSPEPSMFDDDELLDQLTLTAEKNSENSLASGGQSSAVQIKSYPEVSDLPRSTSCDDFSFLVNIKAAGTSRQTTTGSCRAPVDLVTVLDISGSMAGTKLALLKRAMGFVIQNLSSSDRLSVIAFSSTARRLFPLRRMSDTGRQEALQAVNSLVASGGTNIAEGLRKGAKVISDRKQKNPVASIILLSDGQDTYTVPASNDRRLHQGTNNHPLIPPTILGSDAMGFQLPVHAFGFGTDHDASAMHSISEISGGTFSFIETEAVIQDAFAQCIGGLLSVVVQELQVRIECVHSGMQLVTLRAGSYPTRILLDRRTGIIDIGDLYADEERDVLVSVNIPSGSPSLPETPLPRVKCVYKDPLTMESVTTFGEEVSIGRPEVPGKEVGMSLEVDRQRNRLRAAEAMARARAFAEQGDLNGAISILENCRRLLSESASAKSLDRLCIALDAELKEMQERMASRHVYEASGRAYILSGLSSHSWQRATTRGDSTERSSLVQAYQTPSMAEMLTRSQATLLGSPSAQRLLQPLLALRSQPKPR
ncbi:hypothetical protein MLD38_009820 [Melastoma candidum]|uniref:Uncharacterized protein n=1 Tax=Melastoma candidum TaxID=119954 RepID=A0ACB9S2G2_9MYRT|nr:hypothetical protein MLD38_009820 [Melastoma candidum]